MMTKGDWALAVGLAAVSLFLLVFLNFFLYADAPASVVIETNGQEYARYAYRELEIPREIEIQTEFGYNLVYLEQGNIYMVKSDCRDQLDVRMGKISKSGEQLICLPNRVTVRIEGNDSELDGVTY